MAFALIAGCVCAALAYYSYRTSRRIASSEVVARVCEELRLARPMRHRPQKSTVSSDAGEQELRLLVANIEAAESRGAAVAALNEFISDVQANSTREVQVPRVLGRACFSFGTLLALIALSNALLAAPGALSLPVLTPALISGAAGIVAGIYCYRIGRKADAQWHAYRDQVRRLSKLLQQRLPQEG